MTRRYPVVMKAVQHRVVWVDAESARQARDTVRAYPFGRWEAAEPVDDSDYLAVLDADAAADVLADAAELSEPTGPCERCPECGAVATTANGWSLPLARHDPACVWHRHHVNVHATVLTLSLSETEARWHGVCSCKVEFPYRETRDRAAADVRTHCAGALSHTRHVPLGILDDRLPAAADIRASTPTTGAPE